MELGWNWDSREQVGYKKLSLRPELERSEWLKGIFSRSEIR